MIFNPDEPEVDELVDYEKEYKDFAIYPRSNNNARRNTTISSISLSKLSRMVKRKTEGVVRWLKKIST